MNNYESLGVSTPINWKSQIEQVVRGYESGEAKGLVHGFQKDAIQNSWGARSTKKGRGWKTIFSLIENDKGVFLLIQDIGTTGMTGPNLSKNEIENYKGDLPASYKLARFSSMNYSGGNQGAGLFGRGKLLFSAASKDCSVFYETLTKDEGYRANWKKLIGNALLVGEEAYEMDSAKKFIYNETGLKHIRKFGSRIIIFNPVDELIEAIRNGEFINNIQETWWRILLKYNVEIVLEFDGKTKKAEVPDIYNRALQENKDWERWKKTNIDIKNYHKVKNIRLFISKDEIEEDLRDVYVYRKDMKVGKIPLNVPLKIQKKYFGYVEVDEDWESDLEAIENVEHYGFSNRRKGAFQQLKSAVSYEHEQFMKEVGLFLKRENNFEELKKEMQQISLDLNAFFGGLDVDSIGTGNQKKIIEVRLLSAEFPNCNTSRVETNDVIKNIKYKIKNNSGMKKKINYKLSIKYDNTELLMIENNCISINPSEEIIIGPFDITIDSPMIKYEKNIIEFVVLREGVKEKITKIIPLYYGVDPIDRKGNDFNISCKSIVFPRENSKRINTGEKLSEIIYTIHNNSNSKAYIAFHITTHNYTESSELIENVWLNKDIVLDAFSEIDLQVSDILLSKDMYECELQNGIVEVRARISASKDFGQYEMAEELCRCWKLKIYFNRNEDKGFEIFNGFGTTMDKNEKRKSLLEGGTNNWIFVLNEVHPSYKNVEEDIDVRREYIQEEMIKQTLMVCLKSSNYSVFRQKKSWFESVNLSNVDMVEELYYAFDKLVFDKCKVG